MEKKIVNIFNDRYKPKVKTRLDILRILKAEQKRERKAKKLLRDTLRLQENSRFQYVTLYATTLEERRVVKIPK